VGYVGAMGGPTDRHQPRPWRLDRDDAGRDFYQSILDVAPGGVNDNLDP
jgi:hypothetical protein